MRVVPRDEREGPAVNLGRPSVDRRPPAPGKVIRIYPRQPVPRSTCLSTPTPRGLEGVAGPFDWARRNPLSSLSGWTRCPSAVYIAPACRAVKRSNQRIRIETYDPFDSSSWPRWRGAAAQEPDKCSLGARIGFKIDCYCAAVLRIEKACPDKPQINRAMGTVKFGSHRGVDSDVVSVVDSLKPDAID